MTGLFRRIKDTFRFPGRGGRRHSAGDWQRVILPGAGYDYEQQAGDIWRNGALAICLAWLDRNFGEPRPCVRDRGRAGKEVENHPLPTLIARPNSHYGPDALWAGVITSWISDGNAYLVKAQDAAGRTGGLYYVPHFQIEPTWPEDGTDFIDGYDLTIDGRTTPLRPSQVIHLRQGVDPSNTRKGLSPVKAQLREIVTDNEASSFTAAILRNMGVPGFSISPEDKDATIQDADRKAIKATWRQEFGGENRGGLLINSVKVKLDKITLTPEELVLDKIRRVPEARIHGATGVNAQVTGQAVGESQRTYANYHEARKAAYHDALVPMQKSIGRQISDQSPELVDPRHVLTWDYSEVEAMQEDATERAKRAVVVFGGGIATRDEARAMINLGPATDGTGSRYREPGPDTVGAVPKLGDNRVGGDS